MKKILLLSIVLLSLKSFSQLPSTVNKLLYKGFVTTRTPSPIEFLYGTYTGKVAALTATSGYRYKGMTIGIDSAGSVWEYQFKGSTSDADLVLKVNSYSSSEADGRFVHITGNETINGNKYFGGGSLTSIDNLDLKSMLTNYNGFVAFNAFNSTLIPLTASDMQSRLGYLTSIPTLQQVTDYGASTTHDITIGGTLTIGDNVYQNRASSSVVLGNFHLTNNVLDWFVGQREIDNNYHFYSAQLGNDAIVVNRDGSVGVAGNITTIPATSSNQAVVLSQLHDSLSHLTPYTLPTASATTLGGIKVGSGLSISSGVLSTNVVNLSPTTTGARAIITENFSTTSVDANFSLTYDPVYQNLRINGSSTNPNNMPEFDIRAYSTGKAKFSLVNEYGDNSILATGSADVFRPAVFWFATTSPNGFLFTGTSSNAVMEIGINGGVTPTKISGSVRDTQISSPTAGMIIYNTSLNQLQYYNGSSWITL